MRGAGAWYTWRESPLSLRFQRRRGLRWAVKFMYSNVIWIVHGEKIGFSKISLNLFVTVAILHTLSSDDGLSIYVLWTGCYEVKLWLTKRLRSWFYGQIISHLRAWLESYDMSD